MEDFEFFGHFFIVALSRRGRRPLLSPLRPPLLCHLSCFSTTTKLLSRRLFFKIVFHLHVLFLTLCVYTFYLCALKIILHPSFWPYVYSTYKFVLIYSYLRLFLTTSVIIPQRLIISVKDYNRELWSWMTSTLKHSVRNDFITLSISIWFSGAIIMKFLDISRKKNSLFNSVRKKRINKAFSFSEILIQWMNKRNNKKKKKLLSRAFGKVDLE